MTASNDAVSRRLLLLTGALGALAALLVGIAEFAMQFSPAGGYEAADYGYFAQVPGWRLSAGHFLGVLAAPLYLAGYLHIFLAMRPAPPWLRISVLLLGSYGFVIGAVWLGSRVYLGLIVHTQTAAMNGDLLTALLASAAAHNEPLIQVVRAAIGAASLLFVGAVLSGRTLYPRWIAAFSPIALLAAVFASYLLVPAIGIYLLPTAMNIAHFAFFVLSLAVLARTSG
ncbi:MAG: hypothetical protein COW59_08815 [Lysobacterales bacterium CG17_big_fil_post_rev_8_21_14_2_50_64_11]|nr:MAG: hypothetical protein COW59_08815 [Xanthomonadales bacterium CG17_big_fil_post_rev_8_21_14_2_50_64_11]PIX61648.1 MAG: hypothetical protein COZ47_00785 [Xanthomonadales bacterium CG_4_10_14_3_um_filter_64_11]